MSVLKAIRSAQAATAGGTTPLHADLFRWLMQMMRAVNLGIVPEKGIVPTYLSVGDIANYFDATGLGNGSGPYDGWAICNGSNGTPNLDGKFPRFEVSAAGGTGGSDSSAHTHAIDHDHASFTSGNESAHTHAAGTLQADVVISTASAYTVTKAIAASVAGNRKVTGNAGSSGTFNEGEATTVEGSTAAGSAHNHSIDPLAFTGTSGAASATDNRPAYYELVPLMRLAMQV